MRRISALLIAAAAFVGCEQHDHAPSAPHDHADHGHGPMVQPAGTVLKEFQVSKETVVRFVSAGGEVTFSLQGPISERDANRALEEKLAAARTLEEAYRLLAPAGSVPREILDRDARPALPEAADAPAPADDGGAPSAVPPEPLAKSADHAVASSDAWWDWNGDALWWKRDVVGYECQWHEAAYQTNYTSWDDYRYGWYGTGYLMAASHTWGADAYAWHWRNGSWVLTNSLYLKPRHYIVWYSGDRTKQYRRYKVTGRGGAYARIHWGMRWDSQAPSSTGVICHYD